jgi:plastocyanin domain-containing protein
MNSISSGNTWTLLLEVGVAAAILGFLFLRRRGRDSEQSQDIQRIELKLAGTLLPAEVRVRAGQRAQLLIHRFETEPPEELFEIEEFDIYEFLPAGHTTIIAFDPERRGRFPMVLAGEKAAGVIIVE